MEKFFNCGFETFFLYNETVNGKALQEVAPVHRSKEARIQNNARLPFECLLRLSYSIVTLAVADSRVLRKLRISSVSNYNEALWRVEDWICRG